MKHAFHYVVLLLILGTGIGVFYLVQPNVTLELVTGMATAVAYVLWGIVHHALEKDLHPKIVIEYMLIGSIAIILLVTMLGF